LTFCFLNIVCSVLLWLLQVRHPNILSFLHSTEAEAADGPAMKYTIYIVTEPVMPLSEKLKELNLGGTQRYHGLVVLCLGNILFRKKQSAVSSIFSSGFSSVLLMFPFLEYWTTLSLWLMVQR
jgi:hypothetical protein